MDKKERIKELRRKNALIQLCNDWKKNDISISLDNFLDLNETAYINNKIMDILHEMDENNKSIVYEKKSIKEYKQKILLYLDDKEKYIFFVKESCEYGAMILSGKVLKDNIEFILSESELLKDNVEYVSSESELSYNGRCCGIFCCSQNAEKGICLWHSEYDDRIYIW